MRSLWVADGLCIECDNAVRCLWRGPKTNGRRNVVFDFVCNKDGKFGPWSRTKHCAFRPLALSEGAVAVVN